MTILSGTSFEGVQENPKDDVFWEAASRSGFDDHLELGGGFGEGFEGLLDAF